MKILLLGTGMQGKAALFDLIHSPKISRVVAADIDLEGILASGEDLNGQKVTYKRVDAQDLHNVAALMEGMDAVINLLPTQFRNPIARTAIQQHCHYVDASYATPEMESLDQMASDYGVTVLPEFGLDPGIDLVLTALAVSELEEVHHLRSYGAGIPDRESRGNPLNYKISWTFSGVLAGYNRPARMLEDGLIKDIPPDRLFMPENVEELVIDGLGTLETYPNGDAVRFVKQLGIGDVVRSAGRYSMRWPGHAAFWRRMVAMGFLDDRAREEGGMPVSPRKFVHDLLAPQLQYARNERDAAIVRVEAEGIKGGEAARIIYQVLDYRDLETGLLAMQRTVGFTVSIGAQMILEGAIAKHGVLSPVVDVPTGPFIEALKSRRILVQRIEEKYL